MSTTRLSLAFALLAATGAHAAEGERVNECIDLSDARTFKRAGSQYLYVADGDARYRVSFVNECAEMNTTSELAFRTGEAQDRVCPKDTKLIANGRSCRVSGVEKLSAEAYERLTRKRRRVT